VVVVSYCMPCQIVGTSFLYRRPVSDLSFKAYILHYSTVVGFIDPCGYFYFSAYSSYEERDQRRKKPHGQAFGAEEDFHSALITSFQGTKHSGRPWLLFVQGITLLDLNRGNGRW